MSRPARIVAARAHRAGRARDRRLRQQDGEATVSRDRGHLRHGRRPDVPGPDLAHPRSGRARGPGLPPRAARGRGDRPPTRSGSAIFMRVENETDEPLPPADAVHDRRHAGHRRSSRSSSIRRSTLRLPAARRSRPGAAARAQLPALGQHDPGRAAPLQGQDRVALQPPARARDREPHRRRQRHRQPRRLSAPRRSSAASSTARAAGAAVSPPAPCADEHHRDRDARPRAPARRRRTSVGVRESSAGGGVSGRSGRGRRRSCRAARRCRSCPRPGRRDRRAHAGAGRHDGAHEAADRPRHLLGDDARALGRRALAQRRARDMPSIAIAAATPAIAAASRAPVPGRSRSSRPRGRRRSRRRRDRRAAARRPAPGPR